MSRDYYYLKNYNRNGEMAISRLAFAKLAESAANSVNGVSVNTKKKKSVFDLDKPIKIVFRKDGKVEITVDVSIAHGQDVRRVCESIQQKVADSISLMCETVPFSVEVKVSSIH